MHPDEMPAGLADHGLEDRSCDLFNQRPIAPKGLSERIQTVRQNARFAQENGMEIHEVALFVTACGRVLAESITRSACPIDFPVAECSSLRSSAKVEGLAGIEIDPAPEKPVASGWLSGYERCIALRNWAERWFLTSLFLTRLITTPTTGWVLVRCSSGAKPGLLKARRETSSCFQHTLFNFGAPTVSFFNVLG